MSQVNLNAPLPTDTPPPAILLSLGVISFILGVSGFSPRVNVELSSYFGYLPTRAPPIC